MAKYLLTLSVLLFLWAGVGFSAHLPGGVLQTAESLPVNSYELAVSPAYLFSDQKGGYVRSELRYQAFDSLGVSGGFGVGDLGFNLGMNATWYAFAHANVDPEFALLGGIYFNRANDSNYVILRLAPTVSRTYFMAWGEVIPYGALQFSPSFRIGDPESMVSIKGAAGVEVSFRHLDGLRLLSELSLGLVKSAYELSFAIAYPFVSL